MNPLHTPKPQLFGGKPKEKSAASLIASSAIPSSSPAFGTPVHPLKPFAPPAPAKAPILPILLPPATLRPLAFRTFTKKHSLTLASSALQELASFIGKHCGSGWREEGLAEKVLEEVARGWKNRNGGVIVEGESKTLKDILKTLEGNMSGGRVAMGRELSRQNSLMLDSPDNELKTRLGLRPAPLQRDDSQGSVGMSAIALDDDVDEDELQDPRKWLKVIDAYDQPRFTYNTGKKHFEKETSKPSLLPPASHKTDLFRNRFNVIHQRLLRNEAFQTSAVAATRGAPSLGRSTTSSQTYKITPIANLLGRHGSHHMLLGLLAVSATGTLAITDLTGSISLDLSQAVAIPADSAWFSPGMIVLVDGVYEEEEESAGKGLGGSTGIGGQIGGRFQGFFIGQPPCERRRATLGVTGPDGAGSSHTIGGGFGWIDFLGVGSERAVGSKMRRLEQRILRRATAPASINSTAEHSIQDTQMSSQLETQAEPEAEVETRPGRNRMIIIGELNLDSPRALQALRKILTIYSTEPEGSTPITFVLAGNFTSHATMARSGGGDGGGGGGSIEYKESFDALAATLSDFPSLLQASTFVLVPGDNDGWASSFGAGAAVPLPRKHIPNIFTTRVKRVVAQANAEAERERERDRDKNDADEKHPERGEVVFASNPARVSLFGPVHECVLFRDDISARLRRTAVRLKNQNEQKQNDGEDGDMTMSGANNDSTEGGEMDMDTETAASGKRNANQDDEVPYDVRIARKLVKTILDQGYLSPFRMQIRPVHWDWAGVLHLYPLPTMMALVDTTAPPFCVTYEGCHVVNPGAVLVAGRRGVARWVEYEVGRTGTVRECLF